MYKVYLPYSYSALEPVLSENTVKTHYEKHHLSYLDKLNKELEKVNFDFSMSIKDVIKNIDQFPLDERDQILYNAGGVVNHNLYWKSMNKRNTTPSGRLLEKINEKYGSYEAFKQEFVRNANVLVGSGYTFLAMTPNLDLEIINVSNQETPYLYGLEPLLALDLWEHAYYLDYQNRRSEYIDQFVSIMDFAYANKTYEENL